MSDFLDSFMWYGAVIAMAVLLVSLVIAIVRGIRSSGSEPKSRSTADPARPRQGGDET
ncbi:MAG: hypothetical protein AAGJ32_03500 [Pseudomonadota bacterium]